MQIGVRSIMVKIALLGFGTVGSGVYEVLEKNSALIHRQTGLEIEIKYILDLREFPEHPLGNRVVHDFAIIAQDPEIAVVCEMMGGVHPAYDFTKAALEAGKNVVTSNKAVVAAYGPELLALAAEKKVRYLFEASVGGGIPIIRPMQTCMNGNEITEIAGILNGTTNYILTSMEKEGVSFEEALSRAQKLGYAEADPSADIEGADACRKICILAAVAFGTLVPYESVACEGITRITNEDVAKAAEKNAAIKLIGRAVKCPDGKLYLSVSPYAVRRDNPLAHIDDVFNGVLVRGNVSGDLMFYGKGAGKLPTASAVVSDILDIASHVGNQPVQPQWVRDASCLATALPEELASESAETLVTPVLHPALA